MKILDCESEVCMCELLRAKALCNYPFFPFIMTNDSSNTMCLVISNENDHKFGLLSILFQFMDEDSKWVSCFLLSPSLV